MLQGRVQQSSHVQIRHIGNTCIHSKNTFTCNVLSRTKKTQLSLPIKRLGTGYMLHVTIVSFAPLYDSVTSRIPDLEGSFSVAVPAALPCTREHYRSRYLELPLDA